MEPKHRLERIEVTRWIRANCSGIGVLVLTAYNDEPYMVAVLQSGANGYVLKTASPLDIIQAVRDVHEGKSAVNSSIAQIARQAAKKATVPALVTGVFLIGLCTVPCSGAVYLGVLSLLALQPTAFLGYSYLLLYNIVFILPLVAILALASARPTLSRLSHWNLHHKEWVRLALGSGVVMMGLLILFMV